MLDLSADVHEQFYSITEARQKLTLSGLGEFVEKYTLAKLIKICNVRDAETNKRPIELELPEDLSNSELPEDSGDSDLKIVDELKTCKKKFISSN